MTIALVFLGIVVLALVGDYFITRPRPDVTEKPPQTKIQGP